jgi:hypothetical protein
MTIGIERRRRDEEEALLAQERLEVLVESVECLPHVDPPGRSVSRGAPGPLCCGVIG